MPTIGSVNVFIADDVLVFESKLAIDADGALNAYGPAGTQPLDALANAGHPGNWWGIVTDDAGNPVVQGPEDPFPGYYVSTTSLIDRSKKRTDPRRYVDSNSVPYLALPKDALRMGAAVGDLAWVVNRKSGLSSAAVVADVGPSGKIGEGSMALARALGVSDSPRRGGASGGILYAIFCDTAKGWPRAAFAGEAEDAFRAWGGVDRLITTLAAPVATALG